MSYVGNVPYQTSFVFDTFSGTGAQTAFIMQVAPGSANNCLITIGNGNSATVCPPGNYSVNNNTLNFFSAPPVGTNNIVVRYLGLASTTAGLTRVSGGTTGLTPVALTGGDVTLAGTLSQASGGTGNTTGTAVNVSGIVAAANGGTGLSSPGTAGNVLVSTGSGWQSGAPGVLMTSTWTVQESAGKLVFQKNGTTVFSIDGTGNIVAAQNVTGYGTP